MDAPGGMAEQFNQASLHPQVWRKGMVTAVDTSGSPHLCTIQGRKMVYIGTLNVGDVTMWHDGPMRFALGARQVSPYWNYWEMENQTGSAFIPPSGFYIAWQPGYPDTFAWPNASAGFFFPGPWSNAFAFHAVGIVTNRGVGINPFLQVGGSLPVLHNLWTNEHGTSCTLYGPTGTAGIPQFQTTFFNNPFMENIPSSPPTPRYSVDYARAYGTGTPINYPIYYTSFIVKAAALRGYAMTGWVSGGNTPSVMAQPGDRVVFMVATESFNFADLSFNIPVSINQGSYVTGQGPYDGPWNISPDDPSHRMYTPFGVSWIGGVVRAAGPVSLTVTANGPAQRLGTFVFRP